MDDIAPEYDVVVLGTGRQNPAWRGSYTATQLTLTGLTECVLSGYARYAEGLVVRMLIAYTVC